MNLKTRSLPDRLNSSRSQVFKNWETLLFAVAVSIFVVNSFASPYFLDAWGLSDATFNFTEKAMIAFAMALLIITGEIDLSVASIIALASTAMGAGLQLGLGTPELVFIGLAVGLLCGAFNANIAKEALVFKSKEKFSESKIDFLTIGKKINDTLSKTETIIQNNSDVFEDLNYENVGKIADELMSRFILNDYDHIEIIYNSFKNAATQIIKSEQFLPIPVKENEGSDNLDYIFEPSLESIANTLIPKSLKIQLFKAIRDSFASEHGARMTAMHKATDNATELRDELKLTYNKARQASITNEILEIVGGAEALNS